MAESRAPLQSPVGYELGGEVVDGCERGGGRKGARLIYTQPGMAARSTHGRELHGEAAAQPDFTAEWRNRTHSDW